MSDHAHGSHVPSIVSLGGAFVAFVGQFTSESQSTVIVGLAGVLFAVYAHFSDRKRIEADNRRLTIELATERAISTQKDHRITYLEAHAPKEATPEPPAP